LRGGATVLSMSQNGGTLVTTTRMSQLGNVKATRNEPRYVARCKASYLCLQLAREAQAARDERNRLAVCSVRRLPAAAKAEDWEGVRQMLREHGSAIINSVDKGGCSIIHWAIRHGNTEFAKVRLQPPMGCKQRVRAGSVQWAATIGCG